MATICIPKEIKDGEWRVSLAPSEVAALVKNGHEVYVETMAGRASGFLDGTYEDAGAVVEYGAHIYKGNALIIKVKELDPCEFPRVKPRSAIMLFAHFGTYQRQKEFFDNASAKGITAIPYEDITIHGRTPILAVMSKCAGEVAAHIACEYLRYNHIRPGITVSGWDYGGPGILPSDAVVSIIGAGNAGWSAKDVLAPLVSEIHLFDIIHKRMPSYPHVLVHHAAENAYALHLPHSDVIICAAIGKRHTPKIITDEQVAYLKENTLIIDIAIDEGGNCAFSRPTTHKDPIFIYKGIRVYAVPNIPGAIPRSATPRLSKVLFPFVERAAELMDKNKRAVSTEEVTQSFLE